jgi:transposase
VLVCVLTFRCLWPALFLGRCNCAPDFRLCCHDTRSLPRMTDFSPAQKQHILSQYQAGVRGAGLGALARRYAVAGGKRTVQRWLSRWDGTPGSLVPRKSPGRPRLLSRAQVARHILAPIRAKNREARAVHYTELLPTVQAATGVRLSLRSVQRYGQRDLRCRDRRTQKKTKTERKLQCTVENRTARNRRRGTDQSNPSICLCDLFSLS